MKHHLLLALALLPTTALATEVCHDIHAGQGWQDTPFPPGLVQGVSVTGTWTAAEGTHAPTGAQGHLDAQAPALNDTAAHGALLFELSLGDAIHQGSWALFKTMLDEAGTFRMDSGETAMTLRFRINEPDDTLGDNAGHLSVCMSYAD